MSLLSLHSRFRWKTVSLHVRGVREWSKSVVVRGEDCYRDTVTSSAVERTIQISYTSCFALFSSLPASPFSRCCWDTLTRGEFSILCKKVRKKLSKAGAEFCIKTFIVGKSLLVSEWIWCSLVRYLRYGNITESDGSKESEFKLRNWVDLCGKSKAVWWMNWRDENFVVSVEEILNSTKSQSFKLFEVHWTFDVDHRQNITFILII